MFLAYTDIQKFRFATSHALLLCNMKHLVAVPDPVTLALELVPRTHDGLLVDVLV